MLLCHLLAALMADLRLYTSGMVVDNICTTDTLKCCVILCFPIRKEQEEQAVGATYCEKMDDLLCQADFVMVVVSLTPQTHKLIGKREMELMKPSATLVNISPGSIGKCVVFAGLTTKYRPARSVELCTC